MTKPVRDSASTWEHPEPSKAEEAKNEDSSHESVSKLNWGSNAASDNYVQKKSIKQSSVKGLEEATDVFGNADDKVYL